MKGAFKSGFILVSGEMHLKMTAQLTVSLPHERRVLKKPVKTGAHGFLTRHKQFPSPLPFPLSLSPLAGSFAHFEE